MNLRPLPATIDDVTSDWLNAALADVPGRIGRGIVTVHSTPIGGQDSLASAVYALDIGVTNQTDVVERRRFLLKLQHPDPSQRDQGSYAAEAWFYRELATRVGAPVPTTYVAEFDERDGRFVIVQEFLRDGRIGSADSALSVDELERVLSSLAALHAGWWNAPELRRHHSVRAFDPMIRNAIANLRNGVLDVGRFLDRFGSRVHPSVARYYATMPVWMEQVADGFSANATLIHLDCSAKNLFIPRDRRRDPVLFDWALFRCGNPALDVATLLVYSMDPAHHHRLPELVRVYYDKLLAKGIGDYPFDTLWDDFRLACLWRMAAPIFNASLGSPARDAHARTIIPLLDSAVIGVAAFDLLNPPSGMSTPDN